ncbi:bifunctional UDP-N-acetylmuramoyl-tripeptide:D-alanyl-D-alanine ligase/alanine racemase [Marinoscillum furvescens]|uniref:Alanine racemase n=1 Tax=Marinoscillum furvescens DSM 4134 TaxID=1122208 RepID=A0A3D9L4A5_MARFU|nr:bifunctional UDP-N-acetylmuramoyl-tripeptide:D-alanyl-D-alanine ligase/alanine racemase [Marinoscillum furvescens]RED98826.1 alanine racemase [Marinoscillum furvescens DSM 4134]
MHIQELVAVLEAQHIAGGHNANIKKLVFDSRKATGSDDELFIALKGLHHDGHQFLAQAHATGIRNFLLSSKADLPESNQIIVPNTLTALQSLASKHRLQHTYPVVGITGSNAKTIVKEWLSTLLSQKWQVVKSPKSYNSQLGVPLSVWEMNDQHEIAVFEAGISASGEMQNLQQVIRPTMGIFTNIGEAHAAGFANQAQKSREKALLFSTAENVIYRYSHHIVGDALTYHQHPATSWDIHCPEAAINFEVQGSTYRCTYQGKSLKLNIRWTNAWDIENLLHAVVAAWLLGESPEEIQRGIDSLKPVPMRLELKRGRNHTHILDDTYNNDLQGLSTALDYLKQQPAQKQRTVILSDILQSGKEPTALYQEVNTLLKNHEISRLIGVGSALQKHQHLFEIPSTTYSTVDDLLRATPHFGQETILVKGARDFGLEKVVRYLEEKSHGTVLEVNFESIQHNLSVYRQYLQPGTKLMVMVKAFAYGVGTEEIANLLQYHQVDYLGVAYLDEAIALRESGIQLPIMIMNVSWEHFELLSTFRLEPEIYSLSMLKHYLEVCPDPMPIHLKIETGMNRLGFEYEELSEVITLLKANPSIKVAGVFTHFSSADSQEEDGYTQQQGERFEKACQLLSNALNYAPLRYAVNSAGIIRWPQYHFDMVRLGIGLYGFDSSGSTQALRPISTLKTRISQIKKLPAGATVGYSRKGKITQPSEIATIAIGYADGYSRLFGNGNAYVLINGQKAYTIGNVCMDMTMVDVTGLNVKAGDEVIVFGEDPSIADLARWSQTIPYEILTNVSQRVKRVFVSE